MIGDEANFLEHMRNSIVEKEYKLYKQIIKPSQLLCLVISSFILTTIATAQSKDPQAEHLSHHPELAAQATAAASSGQAAPPNAQIAAPGMPPGGGAGMMQGMGEMMKQMGVPPRKDFYPGMVEVPNITQEEWNRIQQNAHLRMIEGLNTLSRGLGALSESIQLDNFARMQRDVEQMQLGLKYFQEGLSAHRLLAEGEPPRSIAMNWLKQEMNISTSQSQDHGTFWMGLSPFHWLLMTFLIAFSLIMMAMYFLKMRRASSLLERLISQEAIVGGGSGSGNAPPSNQSPPSSTTGNTNTSFASQGSDRRGLPSLASSVPTSEWVGRLAIKDIRSETPQIKTFVLADPTSNKTPFSFLPGQFLTITFERNGKKVMRSYTIASSPTNTSSCEITVKREPQGIVSRILHDESKLNDLLDIKAPGGRFVFTGNEATEIVLIGAGVGVTPLMSVLRYLVATKWTGPIVFIASFRAFSDILFKNELDLYSKQNPNLKVILTLTDPNVADWSGHRGRIKKELLASLSQSLKSARIHICGPVPFMDEIREQLLGLGVANDLIKVESFGSQRKNEPTVPIGRSNGQSILTTANTVLFSLSKKQAALPPGMTVLEAAESVSVEIDNSCRAGTCGICKTRLLAGQVSMDVTEGLSAEEIKEGYVLACQAKANESITVEA